MDVLARTEADVSVRRTVHNWLASRTILVKMAFSEIDPISLGLTQGGIQSPLLWPAFFDPVTAEMGRHRSR